VLTNLGFRFTHAELYGPTGLMHPSYLLQRDEQPCAVRAGHYETM
jgi:hypothetical protein